MKSFPELVVFLSLFNDSGFRDETDYAQKLVYYVQISFEYGVPELALIARLLKPHLVM